MANYGWNDLRLYAKKDGGSNSWIAISSWVDNQDLARPKALLEEFHPKGQVWGDQVFTGVKEYTGKIVLEGLFNDAAANSDATFNDDGANIGLLFHIAESLDAGATFTTMRCLLEMYETPPKQKGKTRFKATFQPYGAPLYTSSAPSGTTDPTYP